MELPVSLAMDCDWVRASIRCGYLQLHMNPVSLTRVKRKDATNEVNCLSLLSALWRETFSVTKLRSYSGHAI